MASAPAHLYSAIAAPPPQGAGLVPCGPSSTARSCHGPFSLLRCAALRSRSAGHPRPCAALTLGGPPAPTPLLRARGGLAWHCAARSRVRAIVALVCGGVARRLVRAWCSAVLLPLSLTPSPALVCLCRTHSPSDCLCRTLVPAAPALSAPTILAAHASAPTHGPRAATHSVWWPTHASPHPGRRHPSAHRGSHTDSGLHDR